ncbi:nickel/cobalt transporter [Candidatus Symbiopectobacterium sp. NZEC151]|uniref:nickel/cobalt transporter n=1 Tax=Candidatus Symbiopectobacterium sp. NZEC151 TaxID=2820470 RepID=UPI0022273F6F|nr:nickel/cobalt transporter [Candidatus Symbiopectobacterium sp. NZEC151]MCW2475619.1 nickel/cobalt transporter [Candidatus Symbiopectobacterium sp. NZEC151]
MSLTVFEKRKRNRIVRLCLGLWPLAAFLLLLTVGFQVALRYWPDILLQSVAWQKVMHQQMSALLEAVQEQPHQAGLSLLAFSLVYGILHAVGPGHGKVVITTYLATHPAQLKSSLKLTLASSLLQGMMAIALVSVTLGVLQLSSRALHASSFWMEKASFMLVALLGLWLSGRALKRLWAAVTHARHASRPHIRRMQVLTAQARPLPLAPSLPVTDDGVCGCGHRHLPSQEELQRGDGWRTRLAIVCAMGLRPCSGAILVLLFSKVIGVFAWGVASALAMALGTAITLSALALLVFFCRRVIERVGRSRAPALWQQTAWSTLALTGGMVLFGMGVLLYLTAQPAITGGIRPFS